MRAAILTKILEALTTELEALSRAAKESFSAATDPDSKAENKYDTRSLEASYVARGQAQRVAEVQEALNRFRALAANEPEKTQIVSLGHIVSLKMPDEILLFCIGPAAGGLQVEWQGQMVDIITPASPLGQKLLGKSFGEMVALSPGYVGSILRLD
jgi:transcription elongation GreA/GreB family factor